MTITKISEGEKEDRFYKTVFEVQTENKKLYAAFYNVNNKRYDDNEETKKLIGNLFEQWKKNEIKSLNVTK